MHFAHRAALAVVVAFLGVIAIGPALATDDEDGWIVVETLDALSHSPRVWVSLYEQGSINALAFQAHGGDVRCFSMEFWFADGRKQYVDNRLYREGEIATFEIEGARRTIHRIALNCRPTMGVTRIELSVMVR